MYWALVVQNSISWPGQDHYHSNLWCNRGSLIPYYKGFRGILAIARGERYGIPH